MLHGIHDTVCEKHVAYTVSPIYLKKRECKEDTRRTMMKSEANSGSSQDSSTPTKMYYFDSLLGHFILFIALFGRFVTEP